MAAPMGDGDVELVESDNYYSWLGLNKEATPDEINQAFRRLSRIYHPDKHATDPEMSEKADLMFNQIKRAHDVLSDPHKRAIYDTMGSKGLETDGWEVVSRTKTPQEILAEYERLNREREERLMEHRTNPKGHFELGVDATNFFESYDSTNISQVSISKMSISQSIQCPLTTKDTVVLAGNLDNHNGTGAGVLAATYRRITSHKGWAEAEMSIGEGAGFGIKGFRTLWKRGYGTLAGTMQVTPRGMRTGINALVVTQLDKNLQGRMSYRHSGSGHSALITALTWDDAHNNVTASVQLGVPHVYASLSYTRKFESEAKLRASVKAGTFGFGVEYGCQKKITQFSTLGASMHIGTPPIGVMLKIKLYRGTQTFIFPFYLSEEIIPEAVVYGTVVPLVTYVVIKSLLVSPFLKAEKEKDLQRKKEANAERIAEKKKTAEAALDLMRETVDRSYEAEEKKGGLVIKKGLYGKLGGEAEDVKDHETLNVTRAMQSLVKDSKLFLPEGTQLSELPGFYDPCMGEEKQLVVVYEFRRKLHQATFTEPCRILLPHREHLCDHSRYASTSSLSSET